MELSLQKKHKTPVPRPRDRQWPCERETHNSRPPVQCAFRCDHLPCSETVRLHCPNAPSCHSSHSFPSPSQSIVSLAPPLTPDEQLLASYFFKKQNKTLHLTCLDPFVNILFLSFCCWTFNHRLFSPCTCHLRSPPRAPSCLPPTFMLPFFSPKFRFFTLCP